MAATACVSTETTTDTLINTTTTMAVSDDGIESIFGIEDVQVIRNHYFHPLKGVSAIADSGKDITSSINLSGSVDFGTVGSYILTYNLQYGEDSRTLIRTVDVVEGTYQAPVGSRPVASLSQVVLGEGSYRTGTATSIIHPINPAFIEADLLNRAIPSNGWWTSLLVANYGNSNGIYTNPLRSAFSNEGVEITNVGEGFVQYWNPQNLQTMAQYSISLKDVFLKTGSLNEGYVTKVIDYGASSVKVALRNVASNEDEMVVTYAQGSPYVFAEVADKSSVTLTAGTNGVDNYEFYDLNGNQITASAFTGDAVILKMVKRHIGYVCTPPANVGSPLYADRYFLINTPDNTEFTFGSANHPFNLNNRITMSLGDGNYLSVAAIPSLSEAGFYHDYGYSVIAGSATDYQVDHQNSSVTTAYHMNVQSFEGAFTSAAVALMPHQYNHSEAILTPHTFRTVRGTLKVMTGTVFETKLDFNGLLPGFTLPSNDAFSAIDTESYLADLDSRTELADTENFLNSDVPYWNSKALYPLSQGAIIADQNGNIAYRDEFILKLKSILTDWFTYSSDSDERYLYYNRAWGSVYYSDNEFNTAKELSDHSFTHGYLIYASAVVAMYDPDFISEYGEMVDFLLDDYLFEDQGDPKYAYLRSFDPWAGHSWAHGFGTFAEGNNLESSSEALNSWVAGYLWGLATDDITRVDAAIYGFVTELSAVKEYWFDYFETNWSPDYSDYASVAGMVWGGKFDYATWFGANPTFIYGIQWLPSGEYLTNYALDATETAKLSSIFSNYLAAKGGTIDTWFSNMWTVKAIFDPQGAITAFDAAKILSDDYPAELSGAYWMINALDSLGKRTTDMKMEIHSRVASSCYENASGDIVAMVWNPSGTTQTVRFYDNSGFSTTREVAKNSFTTITLKTGNQ